MHTFIRTPSVELTCPTCLCVDPTPEARCRAIRGLLRPWEVVHLLRPAGYPIPLGYTLPIGVAGWLRSCFERGRLRYISDPPNCDRWCSPKQTLRRRGGDCDDLAILVASVLLAGGTSAYVVTGTHCDGWTCDGHAWVEGRDRHGWFLLEATNGALYRRDRPRVYNVQLVLTGERCMVAA